MFGPLGGLLGGLGEVLGGLGRLLGHLGRLLGGVEAVLDRSWAALSRHGLLRVVLGPARPYAHPPLGVAKRNGSQDGQKSKSKIKLKKEGLEDRLGAVLGRYWVVLGAVVGSKLGVLDQKT